jgi:hypothetical protein
VLKHLPRGFLLGSLLGCAQCAAHEFHLSAPEREQTRFNGKGLLVLGTGLLY